MKKDGTGRGAGVSIERGKRGMGRSPLRHCLGLSHSSPDPKLNTHAFTLAASACFHSPPQGPTLYFGQRLDRAAGGQGRYGQPIDESSRALEV